MSKGSIAEINRLLNVETHLEKNISSVISNLKKNQHCEEIEDTLNSLEIKRFERFSILILKMFGKNVFFQGNGICRKCL